jgi:hypothetical protein
VIAAGSGSDAMILRLLRRTLLISTEN